MLRTVIFLISSATLIFFVSFLSSYTPSEDPFGARNAPSYFAADSISQSTIAKMKLRHAALSSTPYDIGMFGNSRVLNVSAKDIGHQTCRVFNFAVGGESLRASAELIESLGAMNKTPRVVVVSADHFELQMYNNPFLISAWKRTQRFVSDLSVAFSTGASLREIITVAWRAVWTQALAFQRMFEYSFLADAVGHILGVNISTVDAATIYVADGSRRSSETPSKIPPVISPTTAQILPWQLRHDLERIASARVNGAQTVIIYESPLHPTSARKFDETPTPHAARTRETFKSACTALGLICVTEQPTIDPNMPWSDASHPPASILGPFIGELTAPYSSACLP